MLSAIYNYPDSFIFRFGTVQEDLEDVLDAVDNDVSPTAGIYARISKDNLDQDDLQQFLYDVIDSKNSILFDIQDSNGSITLEIFNNKVIYSIYHESSSSGNIKLLINRNIFISTLQEFLNYLEEDLDDDLEEDLDDDLGRNFNRRME